MRRILFSAFMAITALFMGVSSVAYAQAPTIAQTWVSGTVKDSGGTPIPGGNPGDQVTVNCNGNIQVAPFNASGVYGVIYDQSQCAAGDTVTASVAIPEGSGSNSATVEDTVVNGPIVDLDVVVIDITVPEFGLIGGLLTGVASMGGYLYLKAKSLV